MTGRYLIVANGGAWTLLRQRDDVACEGVGLLTDETLARRVAVLLTRHGMTEVLVGPADGQEIET